MMHDRSRQSLPCTPPPRRLRVLEVLEATTGGTRRHMQLLLRHLDQRRFEVTLAYARRRDPCFMNDLWEYSEMGVGLAEISMRREIRPLSDLRALIALMRLIRRGQFDVVHAHSSKAGFLGRLAARLARVGTTVYSPHGFAFQYQPRSMSARLYRWLEKIAGRWTDVLLCVSEGERRLAIEHRLTDAPIGVIPNAIALPEMHSPSAREAVRAGLGIAPDALVVGTVAQFRPQKGYRHFIEATAQVLRECPSAWFLIVGDGPQRLEVEQMIRAMGIQERATLTGHQEAPADFYHAMDVFVLSSLWEGMPYVLLEAMAAGVPAVATDIAGNNELVRHGQSGLLVPPASSQALAEAIGRLLADADFRDSCAQASAQASASLPSVEQWIKRYETLYVEAAHP